MIRSYHILEKLKKCEKIFGNCLKKLVICQITRVIYLYYFQSLKIFFKNPMQKCKLNCPLKNNKLKNQSN